MEEILPGVFHWSVVHPNIGQPVHSYLLADEKVVLDPMVPEGGLDGLPVRPETILLTNRHHLRDSARFVEHFGCQPWASAPGMHQFDASDGVRPFEFGTLLPGDIEAIEIDAICPDETAFYVAREGGIVAVADGVIRQGNGPLTMVPDSLLGDDPEAVKRGLRAAYGRVLERGFRHLLMAHGAPWVGDGKQALATFVSAG